jgi:ketosteroid isomerase-like protein
MTIENDVRAASAKFYSALNRLLNGDAGSMGDIWSHGATVTTLHPIGGREVGWDHVRRSWEQVAQLTTEGQVTLSDQFIQVAEGAAYELGIEHGQFKLAGQPLSGDCRVTNIYRRESGAWKIVHHHTDTVPSMIDVLSRLGNKT